MSKPQQAFGAARKVKRKPVDADALTRLVETGDTGKPVSQDTSVPMSAGTAVARKRGTVKRLTAYVSPELAKRLREHCHATGCQISDVIGHALAEYLAARPQSPSGER